MPGVADDAAANSPEVTPEFKPEQVRGLKMFGQIDHLLKSLHHCGCARDKAGNRQLFYDDYVRLVLLYVFNPLIGSMRSLSRLMRNPEAQKRLGIRRFSPSSFSESASIFDPRMLKAVLEELAGEMSPLSDQPRMKELADSLTLVDASVLSGLPALVDAAMGDDPRAYTRTRDGRVLRGYRLHAQIDLATLSPQKLICTPGRKSGENHEANVLEANLLAGRCYVGDGDYSKRPLLEGIYTAKSGYVMRLRENAVYEVVEERPLSQEAVAAGVEKDLIVRLGEKQMNHPVRLLILKVTPHPRRTRKTDKSQRISDTLLLVSSYTDLAAELIGLIYRYRYTIELFFRFLKQLMGLKHLISHDAAGVQIQVYCAVIACLLISRQTGRKPDKATMEILGWYMLGLASVEDVQRHLTAKSGKGTKLAAKEALWKKLGL